ncbi:MAG: penicillin-binding protein [Bryobacteraceae bacterium]
MVDSRARSDAFRRLTWLAAGALLWAILICAKLIYLQILRHDEYARMARHQQERLIEIPAPRGTIFDRNGEPLAMSVPMDSVFVNPLLLSDPAVAADILSPILSLDADQLREKLRSAVRNRRGFLWIKRKISPLESERLRSLRLEWIEFESESQRHYPKGLVASHVVGTVDHRESGTVGVEKSFESELRGRQGAARMLTDVKRRGIESQLSAEPLAGKSITLSIDERIQFVAERELVLAAKANRCPTGSLVVMNPHTGEILAMANYPRYDPGHPPTGAGELAARQNSAVSAPFEPGSVFKVITLAAALETTSLRPDTLINCGNGAMKFFGRVVHEAKRGFGTITMAQVLEKSSNIGAIQIGMRVGEKRLHNYVRRFGFGEESGIPLPAESSGMFRRLDGWGKTSIASVSMGHEISTTSVQLARACSVIANGGLLVKPRLVLKRQRPGEFAAREEQVEPPVRILKPETAFTMRQMMEGVVLRGTGRNARLEGYSSAGKTGSAQIFDFENRRYTSFYNASFMGFAPVTNPAIVVVVTLNGSREFGGKVAGPVFHAVASEALRVLDVPKDLPEDVPEEKGKTPQAPADLEVEDLSIAELSPEGPLIEEENQVAEVPETKPGPKAPNFHGKSMRAVVEEAAALGVPVLLDGTGIAREQVPPPGAALEPGQRVRVQFALGAGRQQALAR